MAQTQFNENADGFIVVTKKTEQGEVVDTYTSEKEFKSNTRSGHTDFEEVISQREERIFQDIDLTRVIDKKSFNEEFDKAKELINGRTGTKRKDMPVTTYDNFEYFREYVWDYDKTQDVIKPNIVSLGDRDIGLKSKKKVKGYKTTYDHKEAFVLLEKSTRDVTKPKQALKVRGADGRYMKKDMFENF